MSSLVWLEKKTEEIASNLVKDFYDSHTGETISDEEKIIEKITDSLIIKAKETKKYFHFLLEIKGDEHMKKFGFENSYFLQKEMMKVPEGFKQVCENLLEQTNDFSYIDDSPLPELLSQIHFSKKEDTKKLIKQFGFREYGFVEYIENQKIIFVAPINIPSSIKLVVPKKTDSLFELYGIIHELGHAYSFTIANKESRFGSYASTETIAYLFQKELKKKLPYELQKLLTLYEIYTLRKNCKQTIQTMNAEEGNLLTADLVCAEIISSIIPFTDQKKHKELMRTNPYKYFKKTTQEVKLLV